MPNHPQATSARISAGTFDPNVPYDARANTGKGIPCLVPACEFSRIGTRTIVLPRRMVMSAWLQFIPAPINPDASMYVGMQCAIEIHSAAKLYVPHVRCSGRVGARSLLYSRAEGAFIENRITYDKVATARVF